MKITLPLEDKGIFGSHFENLPKSIIELMKIQKILTISDEFVKEIPEKFNGTIYIDMVRCIENEYCVVFIMKFDISEKTKELMRYYPDNFISPFFIDKGIQFSVNIHINSDMINYIDDKKIILDL
jgi:hypothetical protein